MKKTKKKIFGFLGLSLVIAMTLVAAMLPSPGASALEDTVQVRVVGNVPSVIFTQPTENIITSDAEQWLSIAYENATSVQIKLSYTNKDGDTQESNFATYDGLNYDAGTKNTNIDLSGVDYGYGKFIFSLYGVGYEGTEIPFDGVSITFIPVTGRAKQSDSKDETINLTIDNYGDDVEFVDIYLGDELLKTAKRSEFDGTIELPFDGRESGTYTLTLIAKNALGKQLYLPYDIDVNYKTPERKDEHAPDTGRFFQGLGISKEDTFITSLIAFLAVSIIATIIVLKIGRKSNDKK